MIRSAELRDAAAIADIYNPYVLETVYTFEEQPVPVAEMTRRIGDVLPSLPWLVAERDGVVVGYAHAGPWRSRPAYRNSVEGTIYLASAAAGRGLGSELYRALIVDLESRGLHTLIGGIALPNPASVALHEKLGFRRVAHFEQVGWKLGRWVDVGYWQLFL